MFLTSIVRGVRGGVLDRDEYALTFPNVHIEKLHCGLCFDGDVVDYSLKKEEEKKAKARRTAQRVCIQFYYSVRALFHSFQHHCPLCCAIYVSAIS